MPTNTAQAATLQTASQGADTLYNQFTRIHDQVEQMEKDIAPLMTALNDLNHLDVRGFIQSVIALYTKPSAATVQ